MLKKLATAVFIMVIIAGFVAGYFLIMIYRLGRPVGDGRKSIVEIKRGATFGKVAKDLEKKGLIRSADYLVWVGERKNLSAKIQAGEYEISSDWPPERILVVLASGDVVSRKFTIPEGYTMDQIADKLAQRGIVDKQAFIQAASNPGPASPWIAEGARDLEGYLFPETYTYTSSDTAGSIVAMMTGRFAEVFGPMWRARSGDLNLSAHEIVTLASIIEKETAVDKERRLVAGVFMNRLRSNMYLMSDPTVIYGIPDFNGNLTRKHLRTRTPYNTYLNAGLPPGPICNPGAESLAAALDPAETDALYFVSRGDGTHKFSVTLDEHNKAVRRYQKRGGGR